MISVGPFSIQTVIVAGAVLLAWLATRLAARKLPGASRKAAAGMLIDAVFWGFVAARAGYIAQWWQDYAQSPVSMVAIGDRGFSWWVGVLAAAAFAGWRTRARRELLRPVLVGIAAGLTVWFAASGALDLARRSAPSLPALTLAALDGRTVALSEAYAGRPVVLNLWASWCPPCRREMPVFAQAQAEFPHVAFVMVNQGEGAQQARDFLTQQRLTLGNVLLDPSSHSMRVIGSQGLPTTVFFDAQGRLVDTHLGELTSASLRHAVQRHFALP